MPETARILLADWLGPAFWQWALSIVYIALLALVAAYGLHRYWLLHLFRKHRRRHTRPPRRFAEFPRVTVQLPMFNEPAVAERIIDAACTLDYPRDRLQIQVLDDSTDGATTLARRRVEHWAARGIDIQHLHRPRRAGFKAGALQAGLASATGEFIAVFDADFVPPPRFLRRTVHHFTHPAVGMVQARWSHLNRDDSLLTRAQAIFLDGHFIIEHTARNRAGAWINFNGTAGVWRRAAIDAVGGWQGDTLTEDVDLSYRAQLAGWRFVYLPALACPAELPPEMNAFKSQQHRWTKGSIQVALKLLPAVLRSDASPLVKMEAFFHLTSPMVYLYLTLLALLFYPATITHLHGLSGGFWWNLAIGIALLAAGVCSGASFYVASQAAQRRSAWGALLHVPVLIALGAGVALSNALACLEALARHRSDFIRTPKYNSRPGTPRPSLEASLSEPPGSEPAPRPRLLPLLELAMALYMLACAHLALRVHGLTLALPFLFLFTAGYFYVAAASLLPHLRSPRLTPAPLPASS